MSRSKIAHIFSEHSHLEIPKPELFPFWDLNCAFILYGQLFSVLSIIGSTSKEHK